MNRATDISRWRQLDPNVQKLWRVTNLITAVILAGFAVLPDLIIWKARGKWLLFPGALPLIMFVFVVVLGQWLVGRTFQCYRYELGEDDLAVAKGVFWKSWRFVNRNRIQHVDLSSGPIARALGLVQVTVFVGGMQAAAVTIPGLSTREAEDFRAKLIKATAEAPVVSPPTDSQPPLSPPPPEFPLG